MKNFLTILLLIFSISFQGVYAAWDKDWDGINDDIDTQDTYYNVIDTDLHKYFLYDFSKNVSKTSDGSMINNIKALSKDNNLVYLDWSERKYIALNNIGSSRVNAFQNDKEYYYTDSDQEKNILKEWNIIKHVCKQIDIDNNKFSCTWLGTFSEKKFKANSNLDTDRDGVKNFDINWDILDLEETAIENIRFVCNQNDIDNQNDTYEDGTQVTETIWYDCTNNQLGKFSETKKTYFIDTDWDGIQDFLDKDNNTSTENKRFICTQKDIDNQNDTYPNGDPIEETIGYQCDNSQLWVLSDIKKSYFYDSDDDGVSDYLDNDDNTNSDDLRFVCTQKDIDNNKYSCNNDLLGAFSDIKFSHFHDADDDGINDYLDNDDNTNPDDVKYICTPANINAGTYGCTSGSLWIVSTDKKSNAENLSDLNEIEDWGGFGFEKWNQASQSDKNLQTWENKSNNVKNDKLDKIGKDSKFTTTRKWEEWIKYTLFRIAKDLKNLFFVIASIYLLILVLKLLFTDKTEEASNNLKKGGLRITIWLLVMQIAFPFIQVLFDKGVSENLAEEFAQTVFSPLISLLEASAWFFFIAVAIYAFYKLVTANWDEEAVKNWKRTIMYAIMWFIVIKLTKLLVNAIYGKVNCSESSFTDIIKWSEGRAACLEPVQLEWFTKTVVDVINWANGFIWIILVVLIVYTWAKILLSAWNEDTLKSSKSTLLYIAIWVWVLIMNYLILTFFLIPETPIG